MRISIISQRRKRFDRGFTLVELMIVIAIMGTLAAIAVPVFASYVERTRMATVKQDMNTIENEITAFAISNNRFPVDLAEIGLDKMEDAWGNPYQYLPVEGTPQGKLRKDHFLVPVNTDFDLYSMGPDGKSLPPFTAKASRDDIVRANNGQFIGPVYLY